MAGEEPKLATACASEEVQKLQRTYDLLLEMHAEEDTMVKECKRRLEAAQAKSNSTAQLLDKKHVAEALIQAAKYRESTISTYEKIAKTEQERLDALRQACTDQEAVMAQQAKERDDLINRLDSYTAQLESLSTPLRYEVE